MQPNEIKQVLANTKGKFFTVTFEKQDGSIRTLTGRLGVTKYLKGIGGCQQPPYLVTVYDVQNKGYRSVILDKVISVKYKGVTINFKD